MEFRIRNDFHGRICQHVNVNLEFGIWIQVLFLNKYNIESIHLYLLGKTAMFVTTIRNAIPDSNEWQVQMSRYDVELLIAKQN